ncbi:MAG: thiamine pyrophosphate-dependent enzyme [Acidimicrobiaceae bacterium]|nr:thiamine pyrophosphate-dependent enzyme [Acidimicrobiaceae bacterium]
MSGQLPDRLEALQETVCRIGECVVIAGVGSAVFDMARLTENAATVFPLDGAMGAAVSMGLGLALQRSDLEVVVVTGDGELLMNVGSLATVASAMPANLAIVCVDNQLYGLTGGQRTHTATGTDLAKMGAGAGIPNTLTCRAPEQFPEAVEMLRSAGPSLVVLKVGPEASARYPVDRDASACRVRFKEAIG